MTETTARAAHAGASMFEGWSLLGAACTALLLECGLAWIFGGEGRDAVGAVIRTTARSSALLLVLALSASGLRRLRPTPFTGWLLRNRRQVGLAMAASHTLHLVAVAVTACLWPAEFEAEGRGWVVFVGGGTAYALMYAMAITSTDRTAAWLSRESWRRLHLTGGWVLWALFLQSWLGRLFVEGKPVAGAMLAVLAVAPAVRVAAWSKRRSTKAVAR